ncbi:hypothetical protein P8825_15815 [Shouchella clausii]|uniref:Nucleotidyltransferase family protein n=1 Tax=Shouchella clausii TaxID=79880 RepID=A0A268RWB0_SHOCL|nr:hypothetical protein [Shouchella clausii]PAD42252.1 hypothetical protein CHH54_13085 [Bacillus sp. 7520-S]MEB5481034.1 hypothetical protein [Shouchella clausii]PAD94218.1 hypothetical protein CHH52_00300 [Shouchella clausii]PAE94350.1 hypothetical protein CHH71_16250 [Shouchella clausii]PAF24046.1 hypothetical protein CHH61_20705 [Shouchella clausii]
MDQQKIDALFTVASKLKANQIAFSLGGSGLLYALGLTETVNDWDIMTNANKNAVEQALFPIKTFETGQTGDNLFVSGYKLFVEKNGQEVEIIGDFALRSEVDICRIPADAAFHWQGIPVGSPEAWLVAYVLMGRDKKAAMLESYLQIHGANPAMLERLKQQPLGDKLKAIKWFA